MDLVAARADFQTGTSNPAEVSMLCGGVGYRIFRALDSPKCFISAVGTDALGTWLRRQLIRDGEVRLQSSKTLPTARYLAFMAAGRLLVAASDMRVIEQALTYESVRSDLARRRQLRFLVVEGNLSSALLHSLLSDQAANTRRVFECVSVEKTLRHAAVLSGLYLLAGNREEVAAFAGGHKRGRLERLMREREIEHILETRGGEGASLYSRTEARKDFRVGPALPAGDTTGAGDRLLSAFLETVDREAETGDALRQAVESVERGIEEGNL